MLNTALLVTLLPIVIVILSMTVFHLSTRNSMLLGSVTALLTAAILGLDPYETAELTAGILISTVTDNWVLFISLLVFGMLVFTMTRSDAASGLTHTVGRLVHSPFQFVLLLLGAVLLFSVDDYLACIVICMSLTECARTYGLTSYRTAVCVNMLVAGICTLVPWSTWAPVISGALAAGQAAGLNWRIYTFFPMINVLLVLGYGLFHRTDRQAAPDTLNSEAAAEQTSDLRRPRSRDAQGVLALLLSAISLMGTFVLCTALDVENPLLIASLTALAVTVIAYLMMRLIRTPAMLHAFREGLQVMGSLDITLITIWLFTGLMTEVLHIDRLIIELLQICQVPVWMLPALYFTVSAAFGYFTGSSFASFRLMIPLAAAASALLNNTSMAAMLVGAAISGSLFASVALTSDTLLLSSESTQCDSGQAFRLQCRYTLITLFLGNAAYLLAGILTYADSTAAGLGIAVLVMLLGALAASLLLSRTPDASDASSLAEATASEEV